MPSAMIAADNCRGLTSMKTATAQSKSDLSAPTVGDSIANFLAVQDIDAAFGVISIHNMPVLDAIGRLGRFRFIPSRGEAGAVNMADACARVSGKLSAAFTSTGTGSGNAAGALIEALTAGSPVLHITGQIESEFVDQGLGFLHEAPAQLDMLKSISKAAYRISHPEETAAILEKAATEALTAPMGPVSIEVPVDIQKALQPGSYAFKPITPGTIEATAADVEVVARELGHARRPMIMLGGGCRKARQVAIRLADRGIGIVTSTNGRATVPEDHPMSLGAFNLNRHVQSLYESIDFMLVVGSRLRSNETWSYELSLPANLMRVDCDTAADSRSYPNKRFIHADSRSFLTKLDSLLSDNLTIDSRLAGDIRQTKQRSISDLRDDLGPYAALVDRVREAMPEDSIWVRDVTLSNSMWGNRMLELSAPNKGVHALGGGIGQGVPMALGAACGGNSSKTILLTGDGGLSLCLGELITAAEQDENITMILMNDRGYGVIRNIQDDIYGGRRYYSNIFTPNFSDIATGLGVPHSVSASVGQFKKDFATALSIKGFSIVEVDMTAIGPFARSFAGPPRKG